MKTEESFNVHDIYGDVLHGDMASLPENLKSKRKLYWKIVADKTLLQNIKYPYLHVTIPDGTADYDSDSSQDSDDDIMSVDDSSD